MHIYSLCMSYELDDYDINFDFEYLTHEKMYSQDEFENICNDCLLKCRDKDNYTLKQKLIDEYGFKELNIVSEFEFNEDCE